MLSYHPNKTKSTFTHAAGTRRICLLLAAVYSMPAMAGPDDAFHVYGGLGVGYNDNLLCVPADQPAFNGQLGDSWYSADAGLLFDHTYSRQRITARAVWSKTNFDFFKELDYTGKDFLANWNWQVGNHLEGKLGATYNQTLAPYTDAHTSQRNLRVQRGVYVGGGWRMHPSYRLRAAASKDKFSFELESQSFNDRTENAWELGFDYLPASGSEIGLVLRHSSGMYPNHRPIGQQQINQDYDQNDILAKVLWIASGSTTVHALVGWGKRTYSGPVGQDTSGLTGRVSADWKPTGKFNYSAALWRAFAPIVSPVVSYTLNTGASIGAGYDASEKLKFDASAVYEKRKYNARFLTTREDLDDSVRFANLRATWSPRAKLQLSALLSHQARQGSVFLGIQNFTANTIQLNVNAQY